MLLRFVAGFYDLKDCKITVKAKILFRAGLNFVPHCPVWAVRPDRKTKFSNE